MPVGVRHDAPELPKGLTGRHVEVLGPPLGEPFDERLRRHESILLVLADIGCHGLKLVRESMGVRSLKDIFFRGWPPIRRDEGT